MLTSQNGFSANDRSVIASFTIPRTQQKISLRKGDTSVILLDVLGWIHLNIEPLDVGIFDDWGYAERLIRGSSTELSNHASGTAADANATQHPLGVTGTWTATEKQLIHGRLALYEGCVRWGEDYDGRLDGMHFEIDRGAADCKRVADKIRAASLAPSPTPRPAPPVIPEDVMYIKCQPDQAKPVWVAILAGPMFVGIATDGELKSAEAAIAKGAPVQWVEPATWMEFDRRSHALCDNPRPVLVHEISVPTTP